jgi:hypothetical protein
MKALILMLLEYYEEKNWQIGVLHKTIFNKELVLFSNYFLLLPK